MSGAFDEFFLPQPELEHLRDSVLSWLDRVQDHYRQTSINTHTSDHPLHPSRPPKRRVSRPPSPSEPLSPPATLVDEQHRAFDMADNGGPGRRTPSPTKRRRLDSSTDPQATPRGSMAPPEKLSRTGSRTDSSTRASARSGRSSPTKQLSNLSLQFDGVVTRFLTFGAEGLPPKLAETMETMMNIHEGFGVIPRSQMDAVHAEAEHNPAFRAARPSRFAEPGVREQIGPTPSIDDIKAIYSWVEHSHAYGVPEFSWNTDVHSPLLKLAIHGGMGRKKQLLDVINCTSARIATEYLLPDATTKGVDFCIVIDPTRSDVEERVNRLRRSRGDQDYSINHCTQPHLLSRPIAVSIETKREGSTAVEAELQIGTWHAAQWKLLSELVVQAEERRQVQLIEQCAAAPHAQGNGDKQPGAGDRTDLVAQLSRAMLARLPFLPAVVVEGHDWYFAASTREGEKTVLWLKSPFGSTRHALDIYKIVHGLQVLARYTEEVMWPWYQDAILAAWG